MRPGNGRSGTEYPWILVPQLRGLPGRTGTEPTEGSRFPYLEKGRSGFQFLHCTISESPKKRKKSKEMKNLKFFPKKFPYLENGRSSGETGERKKRNGIPVDFSTSAEGPPRENGNGINGRVEISVPRKREELR